MEVHPNRFFRSHKNQVEFMNNLFSKLELKSTEDWLFVTKKKIIQAGGMSLLNYYDNNKSYC